MYAEYLAQGIAPMEEPEPTGYGINEFSLVDSHGNLVRIGSDV